MRFKVQYEKKATAGFTLFELSIALLIIGLVSASIMVGREMIKTAELRSIFKQIEGYETARHTFYDKYHCLPGDCATASQFSLGDDGNGNGYIEHYLSTDYTWEPLHYWAHLSASGLIKGNFTGDGGTDGDYDHLVGVNCPATIRKNIGVGMWQHRNFYTAWRDETGINTGLETHFYVIGEDRRDGNYGLWGGAFSIVDVMSIDVKYDDGLANSGKFRTNRGEAPHHTLGCTVGAGSDFAFGTDPTARCILLYAFKP